MVLENNSRDPDLDTGYSHWIDLVSDYVLVNLPKYGQLGQAKKVVPKQLEFQIKNAATAKQLIQTKDLTLIYGTVLFALISRLTSMTDVLLGVKQNNDKHRIVRIKDIDLLKDDFQTLKNKYVTSYTDSLKHNDDLKNIVQVVNNVVSLTNENRSIFSICIYFGEHGTSAQEQLEIADLNFCIENKKNLENSDEIKLVVNYNNARYAEEQAEIIAKQYLILLHTQLETPSNDYLKIGDPSLVTDICKRVIPDPKEDLNFDKYIGNITEIFSRNAKKHPESICVRTSQPRADYTYDQIYNAVNSFSNYLHIKGFKRGQVISIYAHRCVELVVVIMGALSAGLTYAVLDPTYPVDRLIDYINASNTSVLLGLHQAGAIPQKLSEYMKNISENKPLVLELSNLRLSHISNRLFLKEVSNNGDFVDVDLNLYCKPELPDVQIGPDTISNLGFTSGSTGFPKCVQGRHVSLVSLYPFMKKEFNISEKSIFTMLSGISHDPIQRDIFTPLFFGGIIAIPSPDEINVPGKLIKWFLKYEITDATLTPAMCQLLLNTDEDIKLLKLNNAFFTGDVLYKNLIQKLQYYCPNVDVINIYGSTESQRATAYFHIPSRYKVQGGQCQDKLLTFNTHVPLGIGMKDVNLLVVNRAMKLCGVGECGELYIRSPFLAEGYYDKVETQKKFLNNWLDTDNRSEVVTKRRTINGLKIESNFYMGYRDRIYKTGDLGYYESNGIVCNLGRADDQIKIRGFRVEIKEITYKTLISPLVFDAIVDVRTGSDGDKYLASFFIPKDVNILLDAKNTLEVIEAVRDHLKKSLPYYMVPKYIVPVNCIPINPNNKIDKKKLPDPLTTLSEIEKTAQTQSYKSNENIEPQSFDKKSTTSLKYAAKNNVKRIISMEELRSIISKLLNIDESLIHESKNFFDLGGHSLLATRLHYLLTKKINKEFNISLIYLSKTLVDLLDAIIDECDNLSKKETSVSHYERDYRVLRNSLDSYLDTYLDSSKPYKHKDLTNHESCILLTGASGFLGSFILISLLEKYPKSTIVTIVRAKNTEEGFKKIASALKACSMHDDAWITSSLKRIDIVCGDLQDSQLGMNESKWKSLSEYVDVIIHNGALVHWLYSYEKLSAVNTRSTLDLIKFASFNKTKSIVFVSSTAIFGNKEFKNSYSMKPVFDDDDLERGANNLDSGYAESKWVSEKLLIHARKRGIPCVSVRPGYILGDTKMGVVNLDDFLWRYAASCIEIRKYPDIPVHINVYTVDFVADLVSCVANDTCSLDMGALNLCNNDDFTYNHFIECLSKYYDLTKISYPEWLSFSSSIISENTSNKLYPFQSMVLSNLPEKLVSARLDESNAQKLFRKYSIQPKKIVDVMDLYVKYLTLVNYFPSPVNDNTKKLKLQEGALNGTEFSSKIRTFERK